MPDSLTPVSIDDGHRSTGGLTAVAALDHQVVVQSATPAARRAVESLFRNMREPPRGDSLGRLELRRAGAGWIVSSASDGAFCRSLSEARWELRDRFTCLLMDARPDLIWLHGAGIAQNGHAVVITGPSGSGKSVLATRMIADGFAYLGDDLLPFDPRTRMVYPFPITPAVRCRASEYLLTGEARRLRKQEIVLSAAQLVTRPWPVAAIVFPRFGLGPSRLQRMSPGHVAFELLCQCCDFGRHRETAVRALSALAVTVPAWTLSYTDSDQGAATIARAFAASGSSSLRGAE